MRNPIPNPYVGPRAFEIGDALYGRARELDQISSLLMAERIVLLHSPSGAGKTSLVQAGLIPRMREDFHVLPVVRVNHEPQAGGEQANRYIFSTLLSLEEGLPETERRPAQELALLTLDEYLGSRPRPEDAPRPELLIFDQFEEILTTAPADREGKLAFFAQLGAALKNRNRWALFAAREDFLGMFTPYARPISNRFNVKFRLDLLGEEAAREAIHNPASAAGVDFTREAAQKLVDDLRSTLVQLPDGSMETQLGQYVEPVQLQVVCFNLWSTREVEDKVIDVKDLASVGDVDQSLADYYASTVKRIAGQASVEERLIREWFQQRLITQTGFRGHVLMGFEHSEGLNNRAVRLLEDAHIIRGEKRAGATWYELSHDRLIDPIRSENAAWFIENLSLLQRQATLWAQQGHPEGLLIYGKELQEAEKQAQHQELTPDEKAYLAACQKIRAARRRERLLNRVIMALGVIAVIVAFVAGYFWLQAENNAREAKKQAAAAEAQRAAAVAAQAQADKNADIAAQNADIAKKNEEIAKTNEQEAKRQTEKALAGSLAAQARSNMSSDHALALLLGLEAYHYEENLLTRSTLFEVLQFSPYTRLFGQSEPVSSLAASPDGRLFASASCKEYRLGQCQQGEIILWDAVNHQLLNVLPGVYGAVNSLVFRADSQVLASGGCVQVDDFNKGCIDSKGQIILWNVADWNQLTQIGPAVSGHRNKVNSVIFSPDGRVLASGSDDQAIIVWDVSAPAAPRAIGKPLQGNNSFVNDLVFSPDGRMMVSAGDDHSVRVWDVSAAVEVGNFPAHTDAVNSLAFSPDAKHLVSGGDDDLVVLWDWDGQALQNPRALAGHAGQVKSVAFSPDGKQLASASFDSTIILWATGTGEKIGMPLRAHSKSVSSVAFGVKKTDNGDEVPYLISGGADRTIILWDLSTRQPVSQPQGSDALQGEGEETVRSPDGSLEAEISGQEIVLRDTVGGLSVTLTGQHTGPINSLDFSSHIILDKVLLASASDDQTVVVWDVSDFANPQVFLKLGGFGVPVSAARFSADGKSLLTRDSQLQVIQWRIDPADWVSLACRAVKRNLSEAEWAQFLPGQPFHKTCE